LPAAQPVCPNAFYWLGPPCSACLPAVPPLLLCLLARCLAPLGSRLGSRSSCLFRRFRRCRASAVASSALQSFIRLIPALLGLCWSLGALHDSLAATRALQDPLDPPGVVQGPSGAFGTFATIRGTLGSSRPIGVSCGASGTLGAFQQQQQQLLLRRQQWQWQR
jgi:hypothetical protein